MGLRTPSDDARSLAVARGADFTHVDDLDGNPYWKKQVHSA